MRKFFLLLNFSIIIIFSALLLSTHPAEPSPESDHQLSVQSSPDETARNESCPFYTLLSYGNRSYRIDVWEKEPYCYYLFLPGWISSSRDKYEPKIFTTKDIRIGDEEFPAGSSFTVDQPESSFLIQGNAATLRICYSSALPALWIEAKEGELEKVNASKEYLSYIQVSLLNPSSQEISILSKNSTIHARGNVSFNQAPKKSYLLEMEEETDILQMGAAKKWVLISNYFDQTSLRNYLTLQLAQGLGLAYVPDSRFVDVYVNGSYLGIYLITEKVEVDPERVAVQDLETENIARNGEEMLKKYPYRSDQKMGFRAKSPSDITGGYLVEFELDERWPDEESGFVTEEGQPAVIQSPKHATVSEVNYIAGLFQRLEDSLLDTDSSDIQYQEYIDMESFVKKYLVEELSKNIDANKTSQYFYKYPDSISSKIYAGPPWDYDKGWGNGGKLDTDLDLRDPTQLYASRHIYPHSIWAQLYDKESFQNEVRSCFSSQALPLMETILTDRLPEWKDMIYDSSQMDWIRWNGCREAETDNVEQKYVSSFDLAYEELVDFVRRRTEFLASEWSY